MSESNKSKLLTLGYLAVLQYFVITLFLMMIYPGGSIMERGAEHFIFDQNFFSDLGRTSIFGRKYNPSAIIYRYSLITAGVGIIFFVSGILIQIRSKKNTISSIIAFLFTIPAAIGHMQVARHPLNVDYGSHVVWVQVAFISVCIMCMFLAVSLSQRSGFLSRLTLVFAIVLAVQICYMIFGPRSWSSFSALKSQVIFQKIVAYSELIVFTLIYIQLKKPGNTNLASY